jgi:hypothetical protein
MISFLIKFISIKLFTRRELLKEKRWKTLNITAHLFINIINVYNIPPGLKFDSDAHVSITAECTASKVSCNIIYSRSNAWRLIPSAMSSNAAVKVINESTSSLRFQEASNLGLNKSCKNKVRVCIKISYDGLFGFALNFIIWYYLCMHPSEDLIKSHIWVSAILHTYM